MRSSSIPISSFLVSISFGLASLLPCLSTFSQEEKKNPEKESPGEATGSPEEAFEKLSAQFDQEKALEVYKRIPTVEKFGIVPTKKSVDFLTKLYDQEKSSVIFEAASRALGRIGTLEAVKTVVRKGIPTLLTEAEYELRLGSPDRTPDPAARVRGKEGKMSVIGEALSNPLKPDAEEWLVKSAITPELRKDPQVLDMLLKVIGRAKTESRVEVLLNEIRRTNSPEVQASILESLSSARGEKVASTALHFANSQSPQLQLAAYEVLRFNEPQKHRQLFLAGIKSPHWQLRVASIDALAEAKDKELVKTLLPLLKDKDWKVQVAVVQAFLQRGGAEVIEPLFNALDTSPGRVQDDIADALARLTGKDFGVVKAQWESWWAQNKDKGLAFTPMSTAELLQLKESGKKQGTIVYNTYFGLRVLSSSVAFLIDCSESMDAEYIPREGKPTPARRSEAKDGGKTIVADSKGRPLEKVKEGPKEKARAKPKGPSRLEIAKKELVNVMRGFKDGDRMDVLRFNSRVIDFASPASPLPKLSPQLRKDLEGFIEASKAEGLTNLFGAIKLSFEYPEIDTIYVLSDGAPTMGVVDHQEFLDKVKRLNEQRRLKINAISFNPAPEERKLLQALAERNFGQYVER